MIYIDYRIYGPYKSKEDGRYRIFVISPDGRKQTVSYPKYLMELYLDRYLNDKEEVHHIDGDVENNALSNLEIRLHGEHQRFHASKLEAKKFVCLQCNKEFILEGKKLSSYLRNLRRKNTNNTGPYCSKSCACRYGSKGHRKNLHQRD